MPLDGHALGQLPDDLLGRVPASFHGGAVLLPPMMGARTRITGGSAQVAPMPGRQCSPGTNAAWSASGQEPGRRVKGARTTRFCHTEDASRPAIADIDEGERQ